MTNERVLHIQQNLNNLELSSVLTATIKFGILKNKMAMKNTLLSYDSLSQQLVNEAKTALQYDEEVAKVDPLYKQQMDEQVNTYATNSPLFLNWKVSESDYVPYKIDIDEFLKVPNYNTFIIFDCHEIFVENLQTA